MSTISEATYQQSISWLFNQFPSYQNKGVQAYKPDLGNIQLLIEALQIDSSAIQFIHVAGTNGKGTCTNYIGSILMESGNKTGVFTSPHLVDFRERMIVNGQKIDPKSVVNFCQKVKSLPFSPSFFEVSFAMALQFFVHEKCKYVVLETGLGGRLDATNIVTPILSIITNIGLDHVDLLGDTFEKIAFEKAGIIKPTVPVIIGEYTDKTLPVFEKVALANQAPLLFAKDEILKKSHFTIQNYKQKNEIIILKAIDVLKQLGVDISDDCVDNGFANIHQNTSYMGRFQITSEKPMEIVDVAHNEDGIRDLIHTIDQIVFQRLFILYGSSADKDYKKIISLFPKDAFIYFSEFTSDRSLKIDNVQQEIVSYFPKAQFYKTVSDAHVAIENARNEHDLTLITGSFYLISDFFQK